MSTMSRRALLTFAVSAAVGTLTTGCDGEVHEYEGVIAAKYGHGEINHPGFDSQWTLSIDIGDGYRVDAPVSEYDYRQFEVGTRVKVRGTDGNVWTVTR